VVVTARKADAPADLKERFGDAALPLMLAVTKHNQVKDVVAQAGANFGRLDIVLKTRAMHGWARLDGQTKRVSAKSSKRISSAHRTIREVLPYLRKEGSGHFLGVSSVAGLVAYPISGYYCHRLRQPVFAEDLPCPGCLC
jgi:NADP-dependent 3-hydroxy acid dehydrogenase YdfG